MTGLFQHFPEILRLERRQCGYDVPFLHEGT
jgi:hypothetical protein